MGKFAKVKMVLLIWLLLAAPYSPVIAQCSICTRTAQQQGKEAAEGLNGGIVYLMILPLVIGGFIGYRWWLTEKKVTKEEA